MIETVEILKINQERNSSSLCCYCRRRLLSNIITKVATISKR